MTEKNIGTTVHQNYLHDFGFLIKELALDAKKQSMEKNSEFSAGYMMGFHRIVSLMQQQAEAFGLALEEIGLNGIDPDEDLV